MAGIEPRTGSMVHGVVYTLNEHDFDIVSRTEGVPNGFYQWKNCVVLPYTGDSNRSGEMAWKKFIGHGVFINNTTNHTTAPKGTTTTVGTQRAVLSPLSSSSLLATIGRPAQTLVFPPSRTSRGIISSLNFFLFPKYTPPSRSYLRILQQGARFWKLDRSYQIRLGLVMTTSTQEGWEGSLLQVAQFLNPPTKDSPPPPPV